MEHQVPAVLHVYVPSGLKAFHSGRICSVVWWVFGGCGTDACSCCKQHVNHMSQPAAAAAVTTLLQNPTDSSFVLQDHNLHLHLIIVKLHLDTVACTYLCFGAKIERGSSTPIWRRALAVQP
jgi:hypothetical protein